MNITIETIQFDAGMKNTTATVSLAIGDKPVRLAFAGSVTILPDLPAPPLIEPEAALAAPKVRKQGKKPKKPAKVTDTEIYLTWNQAILKALEGGNLTTNELLDHVMRIRGVKAPSPPERKLEMGRLSVAVQACKKQGLVERVEENGLDKWRSRN